MASSMEMLLALFCVYTGTSLLGISIRFGWVNTRGWRWVHHALFAGLWLVLGGALLWSFIQGEPWRWSLIAIAPFLILLPKFKPGSSAHCLTAGGGWAVLLGTMGWAFVMR
jgi:hypothetical protein